MQELSKAVFTGKWRSFKLFKKSGDIKLFSTTNFKEFEFLREKEITIKHHYGNKEQQEVQTDQWNIVFKDKRHYLNISEPSLAYEVITVNHTVMILADTSTSDKIFFAKEEFWHSFLKSNQAMLM
jgi:hypothetical protein